ncbi:MAG: Trk system potassium transporter TrkA [Chthoniobacterales bacterium]
MNILILGAGEIGFYIAERVSEDGHHVCVVESNEEVAAEVSDKLDVRVIPGNGSSVNLLEEAGIAECDLFLGLSSNDNTNVVAASLAKSLGAKKVVARVHSEVQQQQWLFDYRKHFDIDHLFSSERIAAVDLAKYIRNPDALTVEEIAGGRIELQIIELRAGSYAAGKRLVELNLPQRIRIGSIRRLEKNIVPSANELLQVGDVITLFGNPRGLSDVLGMFRKTSPTREDRRVVIFGGGEYGLALAQMLESGGFRTRIFERDRDRCEVLSHLLRRTTLINADATSMRQLREEQVGEADFFVAATTDDEDNVMTCLQAKDLGARHCITLIHRADYADTIMRSSDKLGITGAISPRLSARRHLLRFMSGESLSDLLSLDGGIDLVEFVVDAEGPLHGKKIAEVPWPEGSGLVALTHGSSAMVPSAGDELAAGDSVVALVSSGSRKALAKLIG